MQKSAKAKEDCVWSYSRPNSKVCEVFEFGRVNERVQAEWFGLICVQLDYYTTGARNKSHLLESMYHNQNPITCARQ